MILTKTVLSTYSADTFGVCSALYELGGLIVMHDASGCNSTYNTHDEPRWYTVDSMVYISGVTERDIILGSDRKLIDDVCQTASEEHPAFISLCGSPLPLATGTDFRAAAKLVERRTGIPTFGFPTNGMDTYLTGAGMALAALAGRVTAPRESGHASGPIRVNLLGVTPLDFSIVGNVEAMQKLLLANAFSIRSTWAMGDSLENILSSSDADVNLVVSATAYKAARELEKRFGIPFVAGVPVGEAGSRELCRILRETAETGKSYEPGATAETGKSCEPAKPDEAADTETSETPDCDILLIGEPVFTSSVRRELRLSQPGSRIRCICPMHDAPKELTRGMDVMIAEHELREACRHAGKVIADPFYARLLPEEQDRFIRLPHEAYSGRYYRKEIPVFIGEQFNQWLDRQNQGE